MPRNWFLIDGTPRPVVGLRRQYVYAQESSERTHPRQYNSGLVLPLVINEDLIRHSNLRTQHIEEPDAYDSLRLKGETISLPFIVRFQYNKDFPCEIVFPKGDIVRLQHIHRLQQFIHAVTGEEMRIRMKF